MLLLPGLRGKLTKGQSFLLPVTSCASECNFFYFFFNWYRKRYLDRRLSERCLCWNSRAAWLPYLIQHVLQVSVSLSLLFFTTLWKCMSFSYFEVKESGVAAVNLFSYMLVWLYQENQHMNHIGVQLHAITSVLLDGLWSITTCGHAGEGWVELVWAGSWSPSLFGCEVVVRSAEKALIPRLFWKSLPL